MQLFIVIVFLLFKLINSVWCYYWLSTRCQCYPCFPDKGEPGGQKIIFFLSPRVNISREGVFSVDVYNILKSWLQKAKEKDTVQLTLYEVNCHDGDVHW